MKMKDEDEDEGIYNGWFGIIYSSAVDGCL